jgi:hypothetical protein
METMYLVVGLALVGLAGIVAVFYFSKRGGKRLKATGAGRVAANRAGASGRPGVRAARTGQTEFALRASGPPRASGVGRQPGARDGALTESWPSSPSDLEEFQPAGAWPGDSADTDPGLRAADPGLRAADPGLRAAGADADAFRDDRPRRRVGFRKGADIDEELWPAESFGGVSDEQFWDDMASDKPLTTTARPAQQEAGPRSRLLGDGPAANSPGRRAAGRGAYPGARPAPEPAAERTTAERTAIQPTYAATQPVKGMTPPVPGPPQPFQNPSQATRPAQPVKPAQPIQPTRAAAPPPGTTPPARAAGTGPAGQPRGGSAQPGEGGRRRRPSSTDDDPLTSSAFSLRERGPVDGRSSHRPRDQRDAPRERNDAGPGRGPASQASPYGPTAPYPSAGTSYDDASSATQMMITPPYGQNYGYGSGPEAPPDQLTEPRRPNGARGHARPGAPGERARPARPAYPQDTRPASGSYPAGGAYPANGNQPGGHQGNGSRDRGHRAPYDPHDDYQRLTHQR